MNLYSMIFLVPLFLILCSILYYKWRYSYWKKKKVLYIDGSIPWGLAGNPFRPDKSFFEQLKDVYDHFKSKKQKAGGFYLITRPAYLLVDTELIKKVLVKDFEYFSGHGMHVDEKNDPLSGNLFNLEGDKWRNMRIKLTPTFTSGKMKTMFQTLINCAVPMIDHIDKLCEGKKPLDLKEILACFTTDVVGSCAFGLECNSFKNPDAEFRKYGRMIFTPNFQFKLFSVLSAILPSLGSKLKVLGFGSVISNFFIKAIREIVDYRERNNSKRNDFIQLLLEMRQENKDSGNNDILTVEQMAAQSFLFFIAGFETTSTTMSFCLHELAYNQEIQNNVREEIVTTMKNDGGILTYEGIMEMKYLNKVVEETLRKYPPAGTLMRVCNKNYTVKETGTVIDKGTLAFISVLGLHRDPQYYPDPDVFDPERFSDENKEKRPNFAYIPFGDGPRICIGLRFGLMQTKVGLCLLLKNYVFTPHDSMRYYMEFHKETMVLSWRDAVFMNAQKITRGRYY